MINIGIDKLSLYIPRYYLNLATLAQARHIDVDKFYKGLGQYKMAMTPPDEDIVTLASNAAQRIVSDDDKKQIDTVFFATESGIDQSKAASIYVHQLLNFPESCRVIELKQACYSSTFALQMAVSMIKQNPNRKVLVIASDIARYGLHTRGESSQGAGAIAMLVSADPRLLIIDEETAFCTRDGMDFWRPNYSEFPFVDGKHSVSVYLDLLKTTWLKYCAQSKRGFYDHAQYCYHIPVPRLVEKAHRFLADLSLDRVEPEVITQTLAPSLVYSREVGNCYTAALYLGIVSMLDNNPNDLSGKRIGLYSYGSGSVAEYFSAVVSPHYREVSDLHYNLNLMESRLELSYEAYEAFYQFQYPDDGSECLIPVHQTGTFRLASVKDHKRFYQKTDY